MIPWRVVLLTDPFIRSLRPPDAGAEYSTTHVTGLSLRVSAAGRKTWSVVYRVNGRLRRFTLGVYPVVGLADARRKATSALREGADGKDPGAAKIEARHAETFADLAKEYVEHHAKFKKRGDEDQRMLYGSPHKKRTGKRPHVPIVQRWGAMKVREITRRARARTCSTTSRCARRFRPTACSPSCARCSTSRSSATGSTSTPAI